MILCGFSDFKEAVSDKRYTYEWNLISDESIRPQRALGSVLKAFIFIAIAFRQ